MNPDLWLALMSIALVAPAMLTLLFASLTGRLGRNEDARYLPIMGPEHDFWATDEDERPEEGGGDS